MLLGVVFLLLLRGCWFGGRIGVVRLGVGGLAMLEEVSLIGVRRVGVAIEGRSSQSRNYRIEGLRRGKVHDNDIYQSSFYPFFLRFAKLSDSQLQTLYECLLVLNLITSPPYSSQSSPFFIASEHPLLRS